MEIIDAVTSTEMTASLLLCDKSRVTRARAVLFSVVVATLVATASSDASARPQITSGLTTGAALTDLRADNGPRLAYHLGGRLEVMFLRDTPTSMAIGPYVEAMTEAFDTFESGGGISWLVPTGATAFVFSGGAFARTSRFGLEPGAVGSIFWGSRSYNYHSTYAIGAGLIAEGRYGLGDSKQADVVLGVQLDLEYLALPFVFAYEAIAH
jgi:hypothetical protein